jgi:spore germination protein GerM
MKRESFHHIPWETLIGLAVLCLTAAGGTAWWIWQINTPSQLTPRDIPSPQATRLTPQPVVTAPAEPQAIALKPQVYWLQVAGNQVYLKPQVTPAQTTTSEFLALETALTQLLKGSTAPNLTSAIPAGTRLLNLQITTNKVHVNLSREFNQGGGSRSMIYRVGQVLYTVTSLKPEARVFFAVEGQPLDDNHPLGGEGLMLRYPMTRQDFQRDFPAS